MTLPQNIQDMIDDFEFLTDWEDRYMHVIDLGKSLPEIKASERNETNKVKGCVSQVWLVTHMNEATPPVFTFQGDSDAHIVKGLVAVVIAIFSNRTASEIKALNAEEILSQLGLNEHLSPQRSNGLRAMVDRIQSIANAV